MYRKNREYDRMQHEKSATWKKCNLTEVQKKILKHEKSARSKNHSVKKIHHEKSNKSKTWKKSA